MLKFLSHTILILLSTFTGYADDKAQSDDEPLYFLSTNKAQTKVHDDLKEVKIDKFSIANLSVNEAVKKLYDTGTGKKGNYSNLIIWTDNKTKISLDMKDTDFTTVLDAICKEAGIRWTIFFYSNQIDYPMVGVSSINRVKQYASLAPPKQKPIKQQQTKMQNKAE